MEQISEDMAVGLVGGTIFGGILGAILVFLLIFYVLTAIASWKILTKAGEKGWKALIPVYNNYMLYKIANCTKYFWYTLLATFVSGMISAISENSQTASSIVYMILDLVIIYLNVLFCNKLSKSFGKGTGFTVGLFFLPNIFQLILGFGSSEYQKIEE